MWTDERHGVIWKNIRHLFASIFIDKPQEPQTISSIEYFPTHPSIFSLKEPVNIHTTKIHDIS